jgi:tetratricopeptide (TPR) repeat protein
MVPTKGSVKITDFGLAKSTGRTKLTKPHSTVGTVAYMSPEQIRGEEVDYRTDIWSLGVLLHEMLTGQLPFTGDYEQAVAYSILNDEPDKIVGLRSEAPAKLERIIRRALAKDAAERYQSVEEVLGDLKSVKEESHSMRVGKNASPRIRVKVLVPALILAFAGTAIVYGIMKYTNRQSEAVAVDNSLAVMYFENLADRDDPQKLGEIVTNLLITDLSESRYVHVVSSQRLYDLLKLQGEDHTREIDRNVASRVARQANARWMLLGSILQVRPHVIITSQLIEVAGGGVIAAQRVSGQPGDEIFSLVDSLTIEVKNDLPLPAAALREKDRPVADVTTHSQEAYRYYLEGLDNENKYYFPEAAVSFEKALELDSTFVMAYYQLAGIRSGIEARRLIARAMLHVEKVSQKEKHYIRGLEAYGNREYTKAIDELRKIVVRYPDEKEAYWTMGWIYFRNLQQFEKAFLNFDKALEIDPQYKVVYNDLAYAYNDVGDLEKSIWAINEYISLAPEEANPYDTRADLYALNGKIDEAIDSYKKALEKKPDYLTSWDKLGHMYLYRGEYAKAENCYQRLCSSAEKESRSEGRTCLALVPLFQGKLDQALQILDDGIAADRMEQVAQVETSHKHRLRGLIWREKGDMEAALDELALCEAILGISDLRGATDVLSSVVCFLANSGKIHQAERMLPVLKQHVDEAPQGRTHVYWVALGCIERAKGDTELAAVHFGRAMSEAPEPHFHIRSYLGECHFELGRLGEAVEEFEKALMRYDEYRAYIPIRAVKTHYQLGVAYESSGWNSKAVEQYEKFLGIWRDADPGISEVVDARERLARLKGTS